MEQEFERLGPVLRMLLVGGCRTRDKKNVDESAAGFRCGCQQKFAARAEGSTQAEKNRGRLLDKGNALKAVGQGKEGKDKGRTSLVHLRTQDDVCDERRTSKERKINKVAKEISGLPRGVLWTR